MASKLHDLTSLGPVELRVADLAAQGAFYRESLGLTLLSSSPQSASLGTPERELVRLTHFAGAKRARRVAGLYHFCLRVEKRAELGRLLDHLLKTETPLEGLVDHRMAEAVYLKDAEGNGIELNWDRPRSQWRPWSEWLSMGNAALDTEGLLKLAQDSGKPFEGLDPQARVGHIHLHVGDLEEAEKFYVGVVGLERTAAVPGQAVFTSAGGYHHHVAFNIWAGKGVPAPPVDALGLIEFTMLLEGAGELDLLRQRAEAAHWKLATEGGDLILHDPWQQRIRFKKN